MQASNSATQGEHGTGARAATLVRVSTSEQASEDRAGLASQRDIVRKLVVRHGLQVIHEFELVGVSGTTHDHPVISQIADLVRRHEIDVLVCSQLDRFARVGQLEGLAVLSCFQSAGARIICADTEHDFGSDSGILMGGLRALLGGYEIALTRSRVMAAKENKRREKKLPTNFKTLPFGVSYDRAENRWFFNEKIGLVVEAFNLFDGGMRNYSEIARRMGIHESTVRGLLSNRIYIGRRVIDEKCGAKRTSKNGRVYREKIRRSDDEIIDLKVMDGVVSDAQFERVQAEMARTRFNHVERRGKDDAINLLTGVGICGRCGSILMCSSGKRIDGKKLHGQYQCRCNYPRYRGKFSPCRQPNLRQRDVERAVDRLVTEVLRSPKHLANIIRTSIQRIREVITPFAAGTLDPCNQRTELQRRYDRILAAYEGGVLSLDELKVKKAAILREREALARASRTPDKKEPDVLQIARLVVKGALRYPRLENAREKKKILNELFSEVHVKDHEIVSFAFRPGLISAPGVPSGAAGLTVVLDKPISFAKPPLPSVPEGQQYCINCRTGKPKRRFKPRTNVCSDCRNAQERVRYHRKAHLKKQLQSPPGKELA